MARLGAYQGMLVEDGNYPVNALVVGAPANRLLQNLKP